MSFRASRLTAKCGGPARRTTTGVARDIRPLTEHARRVSKALRKLKSEGLVKGAKDALGNLTWNRSKY